MKKSLSILASGASLAMLVATGAGYSSWSAQMPTTGTISSVTKIPPPTNAEITQSNGSDVITWGAPTGTVYGGQPIAQSFEIQGSSTGKSGSWSTIATVPGTTHSYSVSASSAANYYRVVTVNNGWLSSYDGGGTAPLKAPSAPCAPSMPAATSIGVVDTAPHLEAVTASGNNIYVMGFVSSKMTIINALTCATTTVPSIGGIIDASYYEGNIWAVGQNNDITEINPSTGATEESIDVHNQLRGVAYGGGYIYTVSRYGEPYIYKVDASTGKLVDTYEAPYSGMTDVIYENGYLWVADWYYNNVSEISASTGQVIRTVYAGPDPYGIAYGNGYIWVTSQKIREPGTVAQINPSTGEVIRSIPVGVLPINVTYGNGAVWVVNYESSGLTFTFGTVSEISGTTGKVLATISRYIGESPWGIIDHNGYVWVVNSYASYVTEIQG